MLQAHLLNPVSAEMTRRFEHEGQNSVAIFFSRRGRSGLSSVDVGKTRGLKLAIGSIHLDVSLLFSTSPEP